MNDFIQKVTLNSKFFFLEIHKNFVNSRCKLFELVKERLQPAVVCSVSTVDAQTAIRYAILQCCISKTATEMVNQLT